MTDYLARAHSHYDGADGDRTQYEAAVACALIDIAATLRRISDFNQRFVGGTR